MQVKKFEARSMKEALEMVKSQLGPDAIILSARDNKKSFGLVGEGSVEITAAVSEETLKKKKFAESRLREVDKEKLAQSSAKHQKKVINNMVNRYVNEKYPEPRPATTQQKYIEIDAGEGAAAPQSRNSPTAMKAFDSSPKAKPPSFPEAKPSNFLEVQALKGEIEGLKQIIAKFQNIPQSLVGSYPGANYGLTYEVSHMFEKLTQAGVADEVTTYILELAQENMSIVRLKNKALVDAWVAKFILDSTIVLKEKNMGKMQAFVGPSGAGKTATLVKLASHLVVKEHKKVAILTTDMFKVGAHDQLRIYAQILNVPFAPIRSQNDWQGAVMSLAKYDHVLIDFPGASLKSAEEISKIKSLLPPEELGAQVHLILSALTKDADLTEIGKRYGVLKFRDVIFTGLDESAQHGNIYNFMRRFESPLHSFGIGTRIPEDFEIATKERLLDLIFKLTNVKREQV